MQSISYRLVYDPNGSISRIYSFSSHILLAKTGRSTPTERKTIRAGPVGGGRGRVNPPPRSLVWRFWEVWKVCCWVRASTRLEAQGLGGFFYFNLFQAVCRRGKLIDNITKLLSLRESRRGTSRLRGLEAWRLRGVCGAIRVTAGS